MASTKAHLRNVRECLGRKEYKEALTHCNEALVVDPACYEAHMCVCVWGGGGALNRSALRPAVGDG